MPGAVRHTLWALQEVIEAQSAREWFPLSEGDQLGDMVDGLKPFLDDLSGKIAGINLKGVPLKTDEGCTYLLSEEGKFYCVRTGSTEEVSWREIAEEVGVLEVGRALANALISRLEQYRELHNLWEQTFNKVKPLIES